MANLSSNIKDLNYEQRAMVDKILRLVSNYTKISVDDIMARSRLLGRPFARHMAMYFMRELTTMKLAQIGAVFSLGHATALNGIVKIPIKINKNEKFAKVCEGIREEMKYFRTASSVIYMSKVEDAITAIRDAEEEFINLRPNEIKECKELIKRYKKVLGRNFFRLDT